MGHKTFRKSGSPDSSFPPDKPEIIIGRHKQAVPVKAPPVEYSFPTKSRCPRCGSTNTTRTSSYNATQYRQCRMPVCRYRFPVKGIPLA